MGMETSSDTPAPQGFDTDAMARLVRDTPPEQLKEGLRVNRDVLIGEIFRRFPERLTSEGRKVTGAIKWKITGREDGGADRWFLVLENGEARTGRDLDVKPRVTLTMDALTFLQVVTGNANPVELFIRRKLRVKGDLMFAARMERLFRIPRSR
jgi:putative sterol carrier protein